MIDERTNFWTGLNPNTIICAPGICLQLRRRRRQPRFHYERFCQIILKVSIVSIANCMIIVWLLTWCLQIRCLSKGLGFQITLRIVRPLSSKGITWTWNNLYLVPPIPHSGIKCVIPFISGRFLTQSPIVLLIVSIAHRLVLIDFCPV